MTPLRSNTAGLLSIIAALLVPGWWVLPQVLAGLGAVSVASASCVLWLAHLQPLFGAVAVGALAYQSWLVMRRPRHRRTTAMLVILWTSLATSAAIAAALIALRLRYWW